jgi:PAS domain S-box-containing protein
MAMFDREMRFIAASSRWLDDLGLVKTPLADSLYDVFPKISDEWKAVHRRCLAGAIESVEVERFDAPKGGGQWVRWEVRPWTESGGGIGGIVISAEDITARIEAQHAKEDLAGRLAATVDELKDSARRALDAERHLRDALDAIPGGFSIYDGNDRLVVSNKATLAIYKLREEELHPGVLFEDVLRLSLNRGVFDHAVADKESWIRARMDLHRDPVGAIEQQTDDGRWLRIEERRMRDGGSVVIRTDITELKNRQRELAQKTTLLEATLDNIGEGIAVYGSDLRLLCCNDFTAQLLDVPAVLFEPGVSFEDIMRFRAERGDYGDVDADAFVSERVAQFNVGKSWSGTRRQRDGRAIETRFNALPDGGGIFVFRDVTEHIQTEEQIREEEARFRSLVEQNVAGIAIVRHDGTIGYCNGCFGNMIGYVPAQIAGRALLDFVPEAEQTVVIQNLRSQLFETGAPVQIATSVRAADGSLIEVLVNASKSTFEGHPASIAVVVDVTARNQAQRELASTAAILASEHETSPDGILVVDSKSRIISYNRRFGEMLDIPHELLAAGDVDTVRALSRQRLLDPEGFEHRVRYLYDHPDESSREELVFSDGLVLDRFTSPFKGSDGEVMGRIWFYRDITERRNAEDSLRASEERFRTLVEDAPDAILLYDVDKDAYIAANKAAERLFGVSRNELLQAPRLSRAAEQPGAPPGPVSVLHRFYAPEQPDGLPLAESFRDYTERALAGEEVTFERRLRRPSGEERVARATVVRLHSHARLLRTSLVDLTEQRATDARLSEVLRSTVVLQEAERRRIARELHDSLSQYLAAANMRLEIFNRSLPDGSPLAAGIAELKSLTDSVGVEVNRLAWELRPTALDDIGLETAIQHLVDQWARRAGLQFDLLLDLKGRRLSPEVETTLYRVLQESITNIVKHAAARYVGVILKATPHDVVMVVEDDGKGFEPENVNRGASPRLGLLGMRERLALIHGGMEIESGAGTGTTLIIRAPLHDTATPALDPARP